MTNDVQAAQKAIEAFVSMMIGRKVKIIWGQTAACTPEGVIKLPRPKTCDAEEIALLTRLAMHEAGHHAHTSWDDVPERIEADVLSLTNVLEDPRMEAVQLDSFRGAGVILNRGLEKLLTEVANSLLTAQAVDPAKLLTINLLLRGYLQVAPHAAIRNFAPQFLAHTDAQLGPEVTEIIENGAQTLRDCDSTGDVVALARQVAQALKLLNEQPPEQSPSPSPGDDQNTSGEDQEQSTSGKSDGDAEDSDKDQSSSDGSAAQSEPSADPATPDGEADSSKADQSPSDDSAAKSEPSDVQSADSGTPQSQAASDADSDAQENQAGDSAGGSQTEQGAGAGQSQAPGLDAEAGQPGVGSQSQSKAPLDFAGCTDTDMGSLIQGAYEIAFGPMDVDQGSDSDSVVEPALTDAEFEAFKAAMEQVDSGDLSLEEIIEEAQAAFEQCYLQSLMEAEGAENNDSQHQATGERIVTGTAHGAGGSYLPQPPSSADLDIRLDGLASKLVRIFVAGLQDKRRKPTKMAHQGARVMANRFWRLAAVGDTKVFRTNRRASGIDAAITLLLDRSGSMEDDIEDAATATLACVKALERVSKVKTSIEMFPGGVHGSKDRKVTQPLQEFGESSRLVAKRIAEVSVTGTTPMAEAIAETIPRLLAQRCEKRILVVITDGIPDNVATAVAEINKAHALGIEVIGIGMGTSCDIESIIPISRHIDSPSELPMALEELLDGQIVQQLAA